MTDGGKTDPTIEHISLDMIVPSDTKTQAIYKGSPKLLILRILLYLGLDPRDKCYAVMASLIETLAFEPNITIDMAVSHFSSRHNAQCTQIYRMIEKSFNVYDKTLTDKFTALTKSVPFTAKDILYDLAMYVRIYNIPQKS